MSRLLVVAVLVGLAGAGVWIGRAAVADGAEPRLPDLDQAVPAAVTVRRDGDRELLVFASAVDNVGSGPLIVRASRTTAEIEAMTARQVVRRADSSEESGEIGSPLRYEQGETHAHWHLSGFARYELRSADGATLLVARKQGFCLGDRYDSRRSVRLAGEPAEPVWTGECGKGRPELRALEEGISVGYGDDYPPRLEGQFVDVSDVPPGRYVLVHVANPERMLREADYGNNAASVALALRRTDGRAAVEVVARCPDTAACAG